jgi:signal transduction histidine kinase
MNALLGSVSNASNLEASIYKESLAPLDFSLLVDTQLEEYRSIYPDYTLQEQLDMDVHISGNSIRLKQMLDKLISNAFEHSKEDTIILVSVLKNDAHVELSVANEGAKLPEDKDRIFDLFVSLRDDEYQKSDSLGLGLYLVKLIAESHGGWVKAEDLKDKNGAIFTVTLPLNYTNVS